MHIVGAIVGEHTYNVDAYDRLQTYYVKAVAYLSNRLTFSYEGEDIADFVARPEFAEVQCRGGSYELWTCRESVWNASFRGQQVGGTSFPDDRFSATFFQPLLCRPDFRHRATQPADRIADERYRQPGFRAAQARRARSEPGLRNHHGSRPDLALCGGDVEEVDRFLPGSSPVSIFRRIRESPRRSTMSAIRRSAPTR